MPDKSMMASLLTLPVFYVGLQEAEMLPSRQHVLLPLEQVFEWDRYTAELPYEVTTASLNEWGDVLHRVASRLLSSSRPLEPEIVTAVNQEFWSLL